MSLVDDALKIGDPGDLRDKLFDSGKKANLSYVTPEQIAQGYKNTQTGLEQQQELLKALQAQNGIQNQTNVFQQQQNLAGQLGQQAQGQGPNPAAQALANQTGANVSQQAALMAGQRGAGANAGMIARQAGQQGSQIQQQAVGQNAQMQAQQQLDAQKQLQAQQALMAGTSGQQVGQQQATANAYQQGALQQQGNLLGAQAAANQANLGQQANNNNMMGSIMGAVGSVAAFLSKGGEVPDHIHSIGSIYHPEMFKGGKVNAMVSPGEVYVKPGDVKDVANGKKSALKVGEKFEGKAKVKGDSPKNDILPKNLAPGGMVIKRSVVNSENPNEESRNFIAEKLSENHHGDFHEALKNAIKTRTKK